MPKPKGKKQAVNNPSNKAQTNTKSQKTNIKLQEKFYINTNPIVNLSKNDIKKLDVATLSVQNLQDLAAKDKFQYLSHVENINPNILSQLDPITFGYMKSEQFNAFKPNHIEKLQVSQLAKLHFDKKINPNKYSCFSTYQFINLLDCEDCSESFLNSIKAKALTPDRLLEFLDWLLAHNKPLYIQEKCKAVAFDKLYNHISSEQDVTKK